MTTNRTEYQKRYVELNREKIREYKRKWSFSHRHRDLVPVPIVEEVINSNAKSECVLCGDYISNTLYERYGNFCYVCTAECARLSRLYPVEYGHMSQDQKDSFEERLEYYEKAAEKFQRVCRRKKLSSK